MIFRKVSGGGAFFVPSPASPARLALPSLTDSHRSVGDLEEDGNLNLEVEWRELSGRSARATEIDAARTEILGPPFPPRPYLVASISCGPLPDPDNCQDTYNNGLFS